MEENTPKIETDASDFPDVKTESGDFILELLIGIAEKDNAIPITLNVGGLIVSGFLISQAAYFKEFMYGAMYRQYQKGIEEVPALAESKEAESSLRQFIHLRNAKIFYPGQKPIPGEGDGFLWRGRIAAVDGYSYERLDVRTE